LELFTVELFRKSTEKEDNYVFKFIKNVNFLVTIRFLKHASEVSPHCQRT